MKKSLIALAVLAASGAAMAQSSVTLYGIADAYVGSSKTEVGGVGQRQTAVNTSGVNGSRWGLKGSEDLGGGMKAIFTLESGFSLDTGASAQNGTLFSRQALVGLQSDFGTVSLGRQYSAYDNLQGGTNNNYDAFTFNARNGSGASGGGVAANGPILVGYAYQQDKLAGVGAAQDKNKYNLVGGSYDFGVAKLTASYNTAKNNTLKDKEGQIGVSVPFGAAAISAGYARSKTEGITGERTGKGYSILGTYALSKRTGLYAGAQNTKAHILNAAAETEITTYGLGVRHSF